jgi:hypothetical protein
MPASLIGSICGVPPVDPLTFSLLSIMLLIVAL